ncbi:MAG TPA: hypothetical protein VLG76_00135 [Rhabdochlamydiaceae bacterium]|nr:hypothetical protein [Rhabdochlamydiaceae bacterium]
MKKELLFREWAIVGLISGLIIACCSLSWLTRMRAKADIAGWNEVGACKREIEIEVSGAVLSPGKYPFSPGVTLKEVLQTTGISKQADRKKINFKKVVYNSEKIEIPAKPKKLKSKRPL